MNIKQKLAENHWAGEIAFTIVTREPDRIVAKMPVTDAAKNPFGTMHAGALIWFADIAATLCAVGDPGSIGEDGSGFPLAVDLHTVLVGNEKSGDLTATSTTVKRGGKMIVVRTEVHGATGRLLIDMTTTHMRAG
ncbi:PaaI family thioesterase [Alisedimentitalea sp. MJ-SS2]|uniref:PaaI family thioesterase n=1 Tax=Aliisedimentitalea sp. MJ-SS2 TaxID=3049795 RepID=UPI0029120E5B|nr:PaaI family thioesterase [Alisedimentitalea sp. MJ-SS2]MDU8927412.1 PaaI family thioesterase [Alisedimentitalea sp. MJ-SS2]